MNPGKAIAQFDYGELEPFERSYVKQRALLIRDLSKKTAAAIVQIGEWLKESKAKIPYGQWLPWLQAEFGWSVPSAARFMQAAEVFGGRFINLINVEIDVSALYLAAAPATPDPVREEIISRAKSGERITHAKATELLSSYRRRGELPPPAVATQIAAATGMRTAANNGWFMPPRQLDPARQREVNRQSAERRDAIGIVFDIEDLAAHASDDPAELVRRLDGDDCDGMETAIPALIKWLSELLGEMEARGKITKNEHH